MRAIRAVLIALVAVPLAVSTAAPARAAEGVHCAGSAQVFSVDTDGAIWRYGLTGPEDNAPAWSVRVQIGRGWSGFGRVLAGPGGRIYGINAQGVQQYRYSGGAWATPRRITDSWSSYATAAYRNKITIDESGDFYLVDGTGRLRWSRHNEQTATWTAFNRVLATGWDRFDLIVAGTAGTLYAREPQGKLFRFRYDPASQRWLEQDRLVGSGWHKFTRGLMSAGGDILFGITAAGDLHHYRFREDNGTWPVGGAKIGSGWQAFPNVAATTDTCGLTVSHTPVSPPLSLTRTAAVEVKQAGSDFDNPGPLHYAYTDNGVLATGSAFAVDPASVDWTSEPASKDYTGKPTVLTDANQTVQTVVQHASTDLELRGPGTARTSLGTAMVASPAVVRDTSGVFTAFGVGADGSFWHRRPDATTGHLLPWTRLAGTGLTGELTAVPIGDRSIALVALGPNGTLLTSRYRDGALVSPWATMGGAAFAGAPAVVILPGSRLRVFGRSAAGDIFVQSIGTDGSFPGTWDRLDDGSLEMTGAPSAVLEARSAKIFVFSRAGNTAYFFEETQSGAATWRPALPASPADAVRSDPTAFKFQDSTDQGYEKTAYVARNPDGGVSLWALTLGSAAKSGSGRPAGQARFVERALSVGR
jgi:hypothetical protein